MKTNTLIQRINKILSDTKTNTKVCKTRKPHIERFGAYHVVREDGIIAAKDIDLIPFYNQICKKEKRLASGIKLT